jgi:low affinity Fe/Cu permease
MVFLIQKSQNKDGKAIQLKLNELIAADERASNRMVDLEDMTEEELDKLHKFYERLSDLAEKEDNIHTSHSIDTAEKVDQIKRAKKGVPIKKIGLTGSKADPSDKIEQKRKKPVSKNNAK